jgi:hypothetical protein
MSKSLIRYETGELYPMDATNIGVAICTAGISDYAGPVLISLTQARLCLSDRTGIIFKIPLSTIRDIQLGDFSGTVLLEDVDGELEEVYAYPPWGIIIEYEPAHSVIRDILKLLTLYRDPAEQWAAKIRTAVNQRHKNRQAGLQVIDATNLRNFKVKK